MQLNRWKGYDSTVVKEKNYMHTLIDKQQTRIFPKSERKIKENNNNKHPLSRSQRFFFPEGKMHFIKNAETCF